MIKKIIKIFAIEVLALYIVNQFVSGLFFGEGIKTFLIASFALGIAAYLVRPIVNLLILPLNLITFGFFRWLSSAVALYLVTLVVNQFKIEQFFFPGYENIWFSIPRIEVRGFLAIILFSFTLSILTSILNWIFK
jgi:putative membrane protein